MEKKAWLELLMDFYGQTLTERQRRAMEAYCGEDYSLSEIAQSEGISRQGVRDALVRAEKSLTAMEDQLQIVTRYLALKHGLQRVCEDLDAAQCAGQAERIRQLLAKWEGQ